MAENETTPTQPAPAPSPEEQRRLDLEGARHRIGELEHKLGELEKQRDANAEMIEHARRRYSELASSPHIAPTIHALVELHRVTAPATGKHPHRYLAAAQKLGDALVTSILEG